MITFLIIKVNPAIIKYMIINDFDDFQLVKFLLNREYVLQKTLNEKLNEKLGKNTKASAFSCKLKRQHLTFKELKLICDILGYDLIVQKRKNL